MPEHETAQGQDGLVLCADRQADTLAIGDLAISYAHAIDDRDWKRFESLFMPGAFIDYTASGGIQGSLSEIVQWMPAAMSVFTWCMHSISTHEIRFTGPGEATGRVHLFNRNGVEWEGEPELLDVGGLYLDDYVLAGDRWRFSRRVEQIRFVEGGKFAELLRQLAGAS